MWQFLFGLIELFLLKGQTSVLIELEFLLFICHASGFQVDEISHGDLATWDCSSLRFKLWVPSLEVERCVTIQSFAAW